MKLIAGKYKGRNLESPKTRTVRPMTNFAKQAVFSILEYWRYVEPHSNILQGADVADCFCGTGAMGLEALSRGANSVTFVDKDPQVIKVVERNVEKIAPDDLVNIVTSDASRLPNSHKAFDVLFVTPPYGHQLAEPTLKSLQRQGWIKPGSVLIVEIGEKENLDVPTHYQVLDERKYGAAKIFFLSAV